MTKYHEPGKRFIMEQLEKAGADPDMQETGALWITAALRGIGHNKTPGEDIEKLRKATANLEKAMGLINECDPWFHQGGSMDELVIQRVNKAAQALKYITKNYPGGHQENSNQRFVDALRRFFISNNLPIALSCESPFVSILGHCINQEGESVKRSLSRTYKADYFQETDEEKALRSLKDVADEAYAASVGHLTRDDG